LYDNRLVHILWWLVDVAVGEAYEFSLKGEVVLAASAVIPAKAGIPVAASASF
jgi:hypothetical protein